MLKEIYNIVGAIPDTLRALPKTIIDAMRTTAGAVVGIAAPLQQNVAALIQPFDYAGQLIHYIAAEGASVRGDGEKLRKQLRTFFGGLENCITQTNNLAKAVDKKLPQVGGIPAFGNELLDNVLNRIPDIALLPVSKALDSRPGWESQPHASSEKIELLIAKVLSKSPQDQFDVDFRFLEVLTSLKMIDGVLKLIIGLLPRDLNAGLAVVGEGGSLTLTGHPLAWVFVIGSFLINEIHLFLSATHQAIKMSRSL